MRYQIQDFIGDYCITIQSGQEIYDLIKPLLIAKESVILDFSEIKAYACPFFNYAIGQLLKDIPYEDLSCLVKYTNISSVGSKVLEVVLDSAKRYYSDEHYRQAVNEVREEELALS
jgi:STAS-like domain of unknown function (DUF4325)